ncbi:unnamed protein product [Adineta steineri]|uniref:Uncharacterized protein n=1 Tax=Adineta steineri TaxID=433720 RepID=A0A815HZ27_9BILA|nr:unnamed protein product [Adineta steineri]CAF3598582.1 unnamed protein product [Adineta steineri]
MVDSGPGGNPSTHFPQQPLTQQQPPTQRQYSSISTAVIVIFLFLILYFIMADICAILIVYLRGINEAVNYIDEESSSVFEGNVKHGGEL